MTAKKIKYKTPDLINPEGKIYVAMARERMYIPAFVDNRDKILGAVQNSGRGSGYFQAEGHRVDRNRDLMVKKFLELESKPEWLVMIDTDMDHPIDLPMRLTKWGKPIVGGLYFYRGKTHEPFVFKEAPPKKDDYGRMIPQWRPMREKVYKFLTEHNVPIRDAGLAIEGTKYSPLIECDAVATGSLAIHRSVIEQLDKPIFEYRQLGTSEDLQFCWEAKQAGIPVYADLSTISGHYAWQPMGYAQFISLYERRGLENTQYTMEDMAGMLAEFYNIPLPVAMGKIQAGNAHMVGDFWNALFKGRTPTPDEVREFYKSEYAGHLYLIELIHWNGDPNFYQLKKQFSHLRDKTVFDFGAGIGTLSIQLLLQNNKVTACEVNPVLRRFMAMYAKKAVELLDEEADLEIMSDVVDWHRDTYDYVIAMDVFEHLPGEDVRAALRAFHYILKPGGRLLFHNNFKQQDLYPMHFDYSGEFQQWVHEAGLEMISAVEAAKAMENVDSQSV